MPTEMMMMKSLGCNFWFASRKVFLFPGLYFGTKRIIPFPKQNQTPELIEFPEQTVVIAKDQPEYRPLPAYQHSDPEGTITFCWKLNFRHRLKILFTGKLWHSVLTFNGPLQPQLLLTDKPEMPKKN
jgi:hypothetical protein